MLKYRLLLGTILIAMIVGLFWLDGNQVWGLPAAGWLFPLILVVAVLGSDDLLWLYSARGWTPTPSLLYGGNFLIVLSNSVSVFTNYCRGDCPMGYWGLQFMTLMLLMLVAFVVEMYKYTEPGKSVLNLALLLFGWCYVGMLLTVLIQLRRLGSNAEGVMAVATLVLFVKLGDTGAYTTGRLFGRHKMCPTLSPGKTWEGAFGAVTWAAIGGALVWYLWVPHLESKDQHYLHDSFWSSAAFGGCLRWMIYAVIMAICGMAGDLAESLLKRDCGRKDSSNWVPGFGGVLDILDSILFVGPVAFICWIANLIA